MCLEWQEAVSSPTVVTDPELENSFDDILLKQGVVSAHKALRALEISNARPAMATRLQIKLFVVCEALQV
jgi:hypothetical protein